MQKRLYTKKEIQKAMAKVLDETRRNNAYGTEEKMDVYSAFERLQKELGFPMEINPYIKRD